MGLDGPGGSAPRAESWVPLFRGADWHEAEAWEMYGVEFDRATRVCAICTCPVSSRDSRCGRTFRCWPAEVKPWPGLVGLSRVSRAEGRADRE